MSERNGHRKTSHIFIDGILAGSLAGFFSKMIAFPLQTLYVDFMNHKHSFDFSIGKLKLIEQRFKSLTEKEGVKVLWRNCEPVVLRFMIQQAATFAWHDYYHDMLKSKDSWSRIDKLLLINTIWGAAAGAMACAIWYPMEISKPRIMKAMSYLSQDAAPKDLKGKLFYFFNPKVYSELYKGLGCTLFGHAIYRGV